MSALNRAKQERIIEAVRLGLEGDPAVAFIHDSGFKLNSPGIARNLGAMGGRGRILALIAEGKTNQEILSVCFPDDDLVSALPPIAPDQTDFFESSPAHTVLPFGHITPSQFETTKLTLVVPTDLYEALRAASRAENKSRNDLIVEILTSALARMPALPEFED